jgi:uncharacterized phage-associated protein
MKGLTQIAEYFLSKESINQYKLQQLCYFYFGWTLALGIKSIKNPLFITTAHGAMNPSLMYHYKKYGFDNIPMSTTTTTNFTDEELELLENVYFTYAGKDYTELEAIIIKSIPYQKTYQYHGINKPLDNGEIKEYFDHLNKVRKDGDKNDN